MKTKATFSLVTTIVNAVCEVALIILAISCGFALIAASGIFDTAGNMINDASSHDVTGGYEVIGGFGLGLLGAMAVVGAFIVICAAVVLACLLIPTIVVGFVSRYRYKKGKNERFIADSILKIVMDGILTCACFSIVTKNNFWGILLATVPIAVVVISIISLCKKNEKPMIE